MRRFTLLVSVTAAIAACAVVFGAGVAGADPGGGATITKDFGCGLFEGGFGAFTTDQTMDVDSVSGNTTLTCHFRADDFFTALPTETVQFSGFLCGTYAGLTTNSFAVINKNGNALLRCQIKANA